MVGVQDYAIWVSESTLSSKIVKDTMELKKINDKGEILVAFLPECPYNRFCKVRDSLLANQHKPVSMKILTTMII